MSTARIKPARQADDETTASIPQTTPPEIGSGHPNFFPMQAVLEIKGSLGKIEANVEHLTKSVDGLKVKVDDLVRWKTLILGGLVVVGVIISGLTWLTNKFSIDITAKPTETRMASAAPSSIPPPSVNK